MSTLKVNTLQNTSGVEVYTAKAWVNFNGTGTVAIRASGNVSSITDLGTGNYRVNFTTAFSDVNYSLVATSTYDASGTGRIVSGDTRVGTNSTTQAFLICDNGSAYADSLIVSVSVFR